ncbi:MAG TPA: UDP-glucose/GDP-mannose dehydrogenase family protein [Dehalococcoidia bacterium]|nr:UDP-glucose/GDP-mannose dehydrogenase family protein [Dehalococcoidia bacterium]
MKISVIGLGHVGLVSAVCLAELGHQVIGVDSDPEKLDKIRKGEVPFFEPGLEELLQQVFRKGLFTAAHELNQVVEQTEVTFVCVDTPPDAQGNMDLTHIRRVSWEIGQALKNKPDYHLVVIKSTVIPTTTIQVVLPILKQASAKDTDSFGLAMNPEFLREGKAVADFMQQDRIILGALDQHSEQLLEEVYRHFDSPKLKVSPSTAELIKYANNVLLASLISFSNEMANIAELIPDINLDRVFEGIYLDKRWQWCLGREPSILVYLKPGAGFGGSCLPKDTAALVQFSTERGYSPELIKSVLAINKNRLDHIIAILKSRENLASGPVSILGLTFNSDTDDIKESPSIPLIDKLVEMGMHVRAYDPYVDHLEKRGINFELCKTLKDAIANSKAALVMTAWDEFVDFAPAQWKGLMATPFLLDCRRVLKGDVLKEAGVEYMGIGDYLGRLDNCRE